MLQMEFSSFILWKSLLRHWIRFVKKSFSCQLCTLTAKIFLLFIIALHFWANLTFLFFNKLPTLAHVMKLSGRWKWRMNCTSVQRICFWPSLYFGTYSLASVPVSSTALHMKPCLKHATEEPSIVFHQIEIKTAELKMKSRGNLNNTIIL